MKPCEALNCVLVSKELCKTNTSRIHSLRSVSDFSISFIAPSIADVVPSGSVTLYKTNGSVFDITWLIPSPNALSYVSPLICSPGVGSFGNRLPSFIKKPNIGRGGSRLGATAMAGAHSIQACTRSETRGLLASMQAVIPPELSARTNNGAPLGKPFIRSLKAASASSRWSSIVVMSDRVPEMSSLRPVLRGSIAKTRMARRFRGVAMSENQPECHCRPGMMRRPAVGVCTGSQTRVKSVRSGYLADLVGRSLLPKPMFGGGMGGGRRRKCDEGVTVLGDGGTILER